MRRRSTLRSRNSPSVPIQRDSDGGPGSRGSDDVEVPSAAPSHRIALLPLTDPKAVEQLARDAIDRGFSVAKLRDRVAKSLPAANTAPGRPRIPAVVRTARGLLKLLTTVENGQLAFGLRDVSGMDDAARSEAKEALTLALELIGRLVKMVGE